MVASVKASLDYFTRNFSPYQHRQVRIIEFPRYRTFAQAFPNTIPYSEGLGFIAKVDPNDKDDIDYPYYVTAHEVAHQWWAHQIVGANVQGATLLSESLAQYSALMVMKATFGGSQMKRFLRHELDSYLTGRAVERKKELPLLRVENQPYIHYNKASLVFYALADEIGEAAVNRALAALLKKHAFRGPPYPTSLDLIAELKQVTPEAKLPLISDLFENITLHENRAIEASARALGKWPTRGHRTRRRQETARRRARRRDRDPAGRRGRHRRAGQGRQTPAARAAPRSCGRQHRGATGGRRAQTRRHRSPQQAHRSQTRRQRHRRRAPVTPEITIPGLFEIMHCIYSLLVLLPAARLGIPWTDRTVAVKRGALMPLSYALLCVLVVGGCRLVGDGLGDQPVTSTWHAGG